MPARPHGTVDRVIQILETVSLSARGVTLAELAAALEAAKSSVQELTNGLLACGYLIERHLTKLKVKLRAGEEVEKPGVRCRAGRSAGSGAVGRGTC
jgi:predicted DNA-binding transcriptional regulator YafY